MSTVKYANDCATIPSSVLSEVLRYARVQRTVQRSLTAASSMIEFFQPLDSSLPQKVRPKSSKGFLSTRRSLGSFSDIVHQYNLNLGIRKKCWRDELSCTK